MSGRTVLRLALAALLCVAIAAPAMAQQTLPEAPMPREKDSGPRIVIPPLGPFVLQLDSAVPLVRDANDNRQLVDFAVGVFGGEPPVAPMPRPVEPGPVRVQEDYELFIEPLLEAPARVPQMSQPVKPCVDAMCPAGAVCEQVCRVVSATAAPQMLLPTKPGCCEVDCCRKPTVVAVTATPVMPRPLPPQFVNEPVRVKQIPTGSFVVGMVDSGTVMPQPVPPPFVMAPPAQVKWVSPPSYGQHGSFVIGICGPDRPMPGMVPARPLPGKPIRVCTTSSGVAGVICEACGPCPFPAMPANPIIGTWARELPEIVFSATFTPEELKMCMTQKVDGHTLKVMLTAHYTITKDGLVYGAITGCDVDVCCDLKKSDGPSSGEALEMAAELCSLVDAPFSFRVKHTSSGLMISHVKCAIPDTDELGMLGGMYKPAKNCCVPMPRPESTKQIITTGATIGVDVCYPERYAPAPAMTMPVPPSAPYPTMTPPPCPNACAPSSGSTIKAASAGFEWTPCPPPQFATPIRPVTPCNSSDSMKQVVAESFGQMMRETSNGQWVGGMTRPSQRYLEHYPQYFAPDPAFPLPKELASHEDPAGAVRRGSSVLPSEVAERCNLAAMPMAAPPADAVPYASYAPTPMPCVSTAPAKPGVVGTWYREVGPVMCVIEVKPDHITATVYMAGIVDGKTVKEGGVITADYHLMRDGCTIVGLITSMDMIHEGDVSEGGRLIKEIGELQKMFVDQPFAANVRLYGDTLVIGTVKAPGPDGKDNSIGSMLAGRYKNAGGKPIPMPKAVKETQKTCVPTSGPSAPYAPPGATYSQPSATYSSAPQATYSYGPAPAPGPGVPQVATYPSTGDLLPPPAPMLNDPGPLPPAPPAPTMPEPVKPVPVMPQPVKPDLSGFTPTSNPNIRMEQSLRQSEDSRPIQNEWRRFWFPDQPSHLTPERVHGGIY
ncbi:MAG: hypothetical protein L0241_29560 [Planctomycetia bacterium]|nr:hypothetical protein [Planctomycetia bacterium]